jgi:hypothetical protein
MALSARSKRKHVTKAMTMLPAGATPLDYAVGGAGGMPPARLRWVMVGGWVIVTVVLSLALKTFVAVGALPMIAVYFAVNKPRGVLLSDHGLASFRCGFVNGRPTQLLGLDGLLSLDKRVGVEGASTKLRVGDDEVWLTNRDLARFLDVAPPPAPAAT